MSPKAMRPWRAVTLACPKCGKPVDWPTTGIVRDNVPQHVVCPGTPMTRRPAR